MSSQLHIEQKNYIYFPLESRSPYCSNPKTCKYYIEGIDPVMKCVKDSNIGICLNESQEE